MADKPKDSKSTAKIRAQAKALTKLAYHGDPEAIGRVEAIPIVYDDAGLLSSNNANASSIPGVKDGKLDRNTYQAVVMPTDPALGEDIRYLAAHEMAGHVAGQRADQYGKGNLYDGSFDYKSYSPEELHDTTTRMAVVEGRKNANWQQYLDLVDEFGMEQVQKWMKEGQMPPKPGDAYSFERMKAANPPAKLDTELFNWNE